MIFVPYFAYKLILGYDPDPVEAMLPALGPIGLIGGSIYSKLKTENKIIALKKQIENIIGKHQKQIDKAQEIKKKIAESFADETFYSGVINFGELIKNNLNMVFKSQKQKIDAIKRVDILNGEKISDYETAGKDTQKMIEALMSIGRVALDVLAIGVGFATGDVIAIGLGTLDLILSTFSNFRAIYDNIQEIKRLETKSIEIEKYFEKGGQFQTHMKKVLNYTLDGVHNLSIIFHFWNSLVNELHAWLQILKIIIPNIEMGALSQLQKKLSQNPVKESFLHDITELESQVSKTVTDSNSTQFQKSFDSIINNMNIFDKKHNFKQTFGKMGEIMTLFSEQSVSYILLKKYIKVFDDLSFLIDQNSHLFNRNKNLMSQWYSQQDIDKKILEKLNKRVKINDSVASEHHDKIKKDKIALIIGSCTDKFYAQDPNGDFIFGYKLKDIKEKHAYMRFLNSSTGAFQNSIIVIPPPLEENKEELTRYNQTIDYLYKSYASSIGSPAPIQEFRLCLCMKVQNYKVKGEVSNRLVLYKRIQHKVHEDVFYEVESEKLLKEIK